MMDGMAHLASVPEVAPKALAYIRVSKEREDMVSPQLQATAIADYCARRGYTITDTITDLDASGRFWKRRQVEQAITAIEDGTADVLVVWKVSRVARNRKDWAIAVDRVEVAGGRLESATEQVDSTTSTGRFTRGMLAELAAFESERIGETWKESHQRRVSAGLPPTGKPKWGYAYDRVEKIHRPDPVTGPALAQLYARYIGGESVYALTRWLNSNGYRTLEGNLWRDSVLRRVLASGFAAGLVTYRGLKTPGVHEPLISPTQWADYEAMRSARAVVPARTVRSQYLLSGLVRCVCGSAMTAGQFGHARAAKYRCADSKERGAHGGGGYVMAHYVQAAVVDWLTGVAADVGDAATDAQLVEATTRRSATNATRLAREITALDQQLTQLTRQLVAGVVPESAYVAARDDITGLRDGLVTRLAQAQVQARRPPFSPHVVAGQLLADWDTLPVQGRREVLKTLVARVIVTTGRPRATFEIVPVWAG